MKKLLFAAIALIALGTTSCKKDWVCECTDDSTGEVTSTWELGNMRKPTANLACDVYEGFGETCNVK